MKIRRQATRISLHRETVRCLDLPFDQLEKAAAGAVASSFCTRTHPHCDTVAPCAE